MCMGYFQIQFSTITNLLELYSISSFSEKHYKYADLVKAESFLSYGSTVDSIRLSL